MIKHYFAIFLCCCTFVLASCSSKTPSSQQAQQHRSPNEGRYQQHKDSQPTRLPTMLEMTDPDPSSETLSRGGNNPYTLFGQNYIPLINATEHREAGIASWYGNKFHGHLTSNGETYNMFSMSAAHKTLPLPSYVKVTNLDNNKTAIVRVNDRGPFHQDRVIDLSYSAAHKLDMLKQGTARVQIELIQSPAMTSRGVLASTAAPLTRFETTGCYIQIFASRDNGKIKSLQQQLQKDMSVPTEIRPADGIFRLLVGPTADTRQAQNWLTRLRSGSYPTAYFFDSGQCS